MIVRNGGRSGYEVAGKGFFELFYRWSRLGRLGQRSYLHTKLLPSRSSLRRTWRPIPASKTRLRHNSTSNPYENAHDPELSAALSQIKRKHIPIPISHITKDFEPRVRHVIQKKEPKIETEAERRARVRRFSYNPDDHPPRHAAPEEPPDEPEEPPLLHHYTTQTHEPAPEESPHIYKSPAPTQTLSPLTTSLRNTMRTLPHPIVILTTALPTSVSPRAVSRQQQNPRRKYRNCRAMTLSSFTSVSFPTPEEEGNGKEPIVSFNIKCPSVTFDALTVSRWFLIHVLDATPEGARLAGAFTSGGGGREWLRAAAEREVDRQEGRVSAISSREEVRVVEELVGTHPRVGGNMLLPRLVGAGVKRVLKCEVAGGYRVDPKDQGFIKVGDHNICLGVVKQVYGDIEGAEEEEALGYAGGVYRTAGEAIDVDGREDEEEAVHIEKEMGDVEEKGGV